MLPIRCSIRGCVMSEVTSPVIEQGLLVAEHLSPNQRAWRRFKRNRPALVALVFTVGLVLLVLLWPLWQTHVIATHLPAALNALAFNSDQISDAQFELPSAQHWFGTDVHGRDLL